MTLAGFSAYDWSRILLAVAEACNYGLGAALSNGLAGQTAAHDAAVVVTLQG